MARCRAASPTSAPSARTPLRRIGAPARLRRGSEAGPVVLFDGRVDVSGRVVAGAELLREQHAEGDPQVLRPSGGLPELRALERLGAVKEDRLDVHADRE